MNYLINQNYDIIEDFLLNYKFLLDGQTEDKNHIETALRRIPECDKNDLVEYTVKNQDLLLENSILFSETSGTTNSPLQTPRGRDDFNWNTLNQLIAYKRELQPGKDRVAILHPSILSPFIEASVNALQKLGVGYIRVFPIKGVSDYKRIHDVLCKYKITAVMSTPSLVYKLLYEFSLFDGVNSLSVNKYLLTGEYISQQNLYNLARISCHKAIARSFVYGSSEAATLMYSNGDHAYKGIFEDFIYELEDIEDNEYSHLNSDDTKFGRLVVTWLRKGLLPIVRYNTNDIFKVDVSKDQPIFTALGRLSSFPLSLHEMNSIDAYIYSLPFNTYNFCVKVKNDNTVKIVIITDSNKSTINTNEICFYIEGILNNKYSVSLTINPAECDFFDFSPKPKFEKFRVCL